MSLTATVTEELAQRYAPDEPTLSAARELLDKKSFENLGVSRDGTWLLGDCKGSSHKPYEVSVDFADAENATFRCNCPSRTTPCKHGLGLLLAYATEPSAFLNREPGEDLIGKREKKSALDEKKKTGAIAPRKSSRVAADKKIAAQKEGLESTEKLLVDLVATGQWFESSKLEKLERHSKLLNDSFLPATTYGLRRLILLGKQKEMSDEERLAQAADCVGQLWATVQKGRNYLENKLSSDETQADADAVIEDVLGKTWQQAELKEKGYTQSNLSLFEIAYERTDDEARQQRVETSNLIDLGSGAIYQGISYRPFKGLNQIPEQPSFMVPITLAEATIFPGFVNRRIRWEKGSEQLVESGGNKHLETVYQLAKPDFKTLLEELRAQFKHPLAPREAVALVRCEQIGRVGENIVIEDSTGARIEAQDKRKDYSNVANLIRAAGMLGQEKPALLIRIFLMALPNTIAAQPLAALTPKYHLRLGI